MDPDLQVAVLTASPAQQLLATLPPPLTILNRALLTHSLCQRSLGRCVVRPSHLYNCRYPGHNAMLCRATRVTLAPFLPYSDAGTNLQVSCARLSFAAPCTTAPRLPAVAPSWFLVHRVPATDTIESINCPRRLTPPSRISRLRRNDLLLFYTMRSFSVWLVLLRSGVQCTEATQ